MEKFTAVFGSEEGWWIGYVEELPGANTQGRTLDEIKNRLAHKICKDLDRPLP